MNSFTILVLIAIAYSVNANGGYGAMPKISPPRLSSNYGGQAPRTPTPTSNYGSQAPRFTAPVPQSAPVSSYGSEAPRAPAPAPVSSYGSEAPRAPAPAPVSSYGSQAPRAEVPSFNPCTEEVMRAGEISLFANPSDQSSYLICTDVDVFISMPCSPNTIFDSSLRHCIPIGWKAPLCPVGTCQNQADCIIDETFNYLCLCRVGFTGKFCEINIDECALEGNRVCSSYNGQCVDQVNGFYCQWGNEIGLIWENRIANPCTLENLANERQFFELLSSQGNVFLQCTGEMTFIVSKCAEMLYWHQELKTCSIEKPLPKTGICNSYPCKNDGECIDLGGSNFQCLCKSGYTGSLCESAIDFCLNNPCSYGGRCVSHPNGYNCICADKVVDESCATGVQNPCPLGSRDYLPNPLFNYKYFICSVDGLAFSRDCAPGLIWSQDLLTCKFAVEPIAPQHVKPQKSIPMSIAPVASYGQQQQALPQRPPMTQAPVQSYGQQEIAAPRPPMTQAPVQSYGQQEIAAPRPPMTQAPVQSYGQQEIVAPRPPMAAAPVASYGQQQQALPQRPPMTQAPVQSYGQQEIVAPRRPMTSVPVQSSYGQSRPMTSQPITKPSYSQMLKMRA